MFCTHPTKAVMRMLLSDYIRLVNVHTEHILYDEKVGLAFEDNPPHVLFALFALRLRVAMAPGMVCMCRTWDLITTRRPSLPRAGAGNSFMYFVLLMKDDPSLYIFQSNLGLPRGD